MPLPCPVALLLVLLLQAACGGGSDPVETGSVSGNGPSDAPTATLASIGGFTLAAAPPETLDVVWSGGGPSKVLSVRSFPEGEVVPGDTLLTLEDAVRRVELERLEMEVRLAAALAAADSSDGPRSRLDSLSALLDSLGRTAVLPVLSPAGGLLISIQVVAGDDASPGALLARLSVGPESLFVASPPSGVRMTSWPSVAGTLRLMEQTPSEALYYGSPDPEGSDFRCLFLVVRNALYEDGLRTFIVTLAGDTLEAGMAGSTESGIVVRVPLGEAGMEVRTWGS